MISVKKTPLLVYLTVNGISVPHYCFYNGLSIAGNCRVCLIELERAPKPIISCSTGTELIFNVNKIYFESPLVKKARENIIEFLLLNHPLDCPICDQGGDCDLQDQSIFFGFTKRRFYKFKRIVHNKKLGPLVKTVMTRCIHCTRCVRFLADVCGLTELGVFGRTKNSEIGCFLNKIMLSELSGNVIDLCPVGYLNFKNGCFNE